VEPDRDPGAVLQSCLVAAVLGPERFPGRTLLLRRLRLGYPANVRVISVVEILPLRVNGVFSYVLLDITPA